MALVYCESMQDTSIHTLDITLLQPNPFQPRELIKSEDLAELIDSIKQFGVLEPLLIAQTPAGYQIIAGERRWRAAQQAGLTEVPVVVKKTTPKEMLEMAIIENIQRVDLGALERAQAFSQLIRTFNYTVNEVSKRVGKSQPYISNSLRLLKLPDAVKDGLLGGLINEGHARAIGGIDDPHTMIEVYKKILKTNASVRQAEQLARIAKEKLGQEQYTKKVEKPSQEVIDEVVVWEAQLKRLLASKSMVKLQRSRSQTKITITLKGSPDKTQRDLEKIMAITVKEK